MDRRKNPMTRLLDAVQGRFRRARPGSVLIMVVSLLVLLALIGTAALSTSRLDRVSMQQHVRNTQVDILATSVREMVVSYLTQDLTDGSGVNRTDSAISSPVSPTPSGELRDSIIGSRIPERMFTVLPDQAPGVREDPMNHIIGGSRRPQTPPQDAFVWNSPSYPPVQNGQNNQTFRLDLPNEASDDPSAGYLYYLPLPKPRFRPTTITLNGQTYPALTAVDAYGAPKESIDVFNTTTGQMETYPLRIGAVADTTTGHRAFLAADADGDGIADSLLFKLPMAPITGITYYGAVRVVDNAAAINVNTAWSAFTDRAEVMTKGLSTAANPQPWVPGVISLAGAHPGGIDIESLLDPNTTPAQLNPPQTTEPQIPEMAQVNGQRVWGDRYRGGTVNANMFRPVVPPAQPSGSTSRTIMNPFSESFYDPLEPPNTTANFAFEAVVPRNDYLFVTPNDALDKQLGRRLDYPGPWAPKNPASVQTNRDDWEFWGNGVRPFGVGDSIALAYRFTILNADSSDSTVERALFMSTVDNSRRRGTGKYQPSGTTPAQAQAQVNKWFLDQFDYPWVTVPGGAAPSRNPAMAGYNSGYTINGAGAGFEYPTDPLPMRALITTLNPVRNDVDTMAPGSSFHLPRYLLNLNGDLSLIAGTQNRPFWNQEYLLEVRDNDAAIDLVVKTPTIPTTKVNVNTAGFADMWAAYMNVMKESARRTPFDFGQHDEIYRGNRFDPTQTPGQFASVLTEEHMARMFRSPLRPLGTEDPTATPPENFNGVLRMHPYQVLTLRAAIAAVNTQALRSDLDVKDPADPTRYVISDRMIPFADLLLPQVKDTHDPMLDPRPNTTSFYAGLGATVYGVKRQPFITEVLMNNNVEVIPTLPPGRQQNPSGFAAIEIHNPYDRPMDVSGWKLSVIDRRPITPDSGNPDVDDPEVTPGANRAKWVNTGGNRNALPGLKMIDLPSNAYAPATRWDPTQGTPEGDAAAGATDPDLDGSDSQRFRIPPNTYIPPGGHLIISNYPVDQGTVPALPAADLDTARYAPAGLETQWPTLFAQAINTQPTPNNNLKYRPGGVTLLHAKYLHHAIGKEVVLSRPVVAYEDPNPNVGTDAPIEHKLRWAPVDSFDATGLKHQTFIAGTEVPRATFTRQWHYARASDPATGRAWHFVYPGRYNASRPFVEQVAANAANPLVLRDPHHQGIQVGIFSVPAGTPANIPDPWFTTGTGPTVPITFGALNPQNSRDNGVQYPTAASTFPIQVASTDFTNHFDDSRLAMANNPTGGFPTNPMHGFLRAGDIQHVTFIGSYTIWDPKHWQYDPNMAAQQQGNNRIPQPPYAYDPNDPTFGDQVQDSADPTVGAITRRTFAHNPKFVEVNTISMDAAFAEDTDPSNDRNPWDDGLPAGSAIRPLEDIGRFAPFNVVRREGGPYFFGDLQAQQYIGTTSGDDIDDGTISILETESLLSTRSLRTGFPNNFWNGYEVIIENLQPNPADPWEVQQAYVALVNGFTKTVNTPRGPRARIEFAAPLRYPLQRLDSTGAPRTYRFRLQRIRYGWATKLFDYFTTTRSPADDFSPNVDPDFFRERALKGAVDYVRGGAQEMIPNPLPGWYPTKNVRDPAHGINRQPDLVVGQPGPLHEDDVPSEGLININTASWRVLAQLPLVMREDDPTRVDHFATEYLARQIVYFRDIDDGRGFNPNDPNYANPAQRQFMPRPHGPFKSIFELLLIPEFEASRTPAAGNPYAASVNPNDPPRNLLPTQNPNRDWSVDRLDYDPNVNDGDYSPLSDPASPRGDGVRWDWKEKFLMINRISNLVTLKSDCYTAYIQVQGWRDAGTKDATLVSQKRLAFIVDRSRINATKRSPTVYNVPVAE